MKGSDEWQTFTQSYEIRPELTVVEAYIRFTKTPVIIDEVSVVEVTE